MSKHDEIEKGESIFHQNAVCIEHILFLLNKLYFGPTYDHEKKFFF